MSVTGVFYRSVIDDVINNVRETFLDDGIDEQVLVELKQIWENKLMQSKAVPPENIPPEAEHPQVTQAAPTAPAPAPTPTPARTQASVTVSQAITAPSTVVTQPTLHYYSTAPHGGNDPPKTVTFTLPQAVGSGQKPVTITLPGHLVQQTAAGLVMSSPAAAAAQALPAGLAAGILQSPLSINAAGVITQQQADGTTVYQTVTAEQLSKQGYVVSVTPGTAQPTTTATQIHPVQVTSAGSIIQLDGANDTSEEDDDDDDARDDDNDAEEDEQNEEENDGGGEEEEPLNSEDDVSDEDPSELFDTDNVIVCQYDKITRSRNKWKFHLKDGIMNVQGRDYVFQRASGDAEW